MDLLNVAYFVYHTLLLATVSYAFYLGIRYGFRNQHFIAAYLLLTFIVEAGVRLRTVLFHDHKYNGLVYELYIIFSVNFFAYYYYQTFVNKIKYLPPAMALIANVFFLYNTEFFNEVIDTHAGILMSVYYILLALLWFYYKINYGMESRMSDSPRYWVSTALLLWGGFFIFRIVPAAYILENDRVFWLHLKIIHIVVCAVMYLLFFVALFKYRKKMPPKSEVI